MDFIIYSHPFKIINRWFNHLIFPWINQSVFHKNYIPWIRCQILHLNSAEKWSIILSLSIPIRMKSSNLRSNRQRRKFCQHWKSVYLYLSILYITNWRHSWSVLSFLLLFYMLYTVRFSFLSSPIKISSVIILQIHAVRCRTVF